MYVDYVNIHLLLFILPGEHLRILTLTVIALSVMWPQDHFELL